MKKSSFEGFILDMFSGEVESVKIDSTEEGYLSNLYLTIRPY